MASRGILIIGESGSGKSTSLRNLNSEETFLVNIVNKDLPFKGANSKYIPYDKATKKGNLYHSTNPASVIGLLNHVSETLPNIKTIVIDDTNYLWALEFINRAKETSYAKFNEIGANIANVLQQAFKLRDNLTVIFLAHSDTNTDIDGNSKTKLKTIGKMVA